MYLGVVQQLSGSLNVTEYVLLLEPSLYTLVSVQ